MLTSVECPPIQGTINISAISFQKACCTVSESFAFLELPLIRTQCVKPTQCNLNWVGGASGNQLLLIRSQCSCVAYTVPLGAAGSHKTITSIIICAVKTDIYSRSSVKQWSIFKENQCGWSGMNKKYAWPTSLFDPLKLCVMFDLIQKHKPGSSCSTRRDCVGKHKDKTGLIRI